MMSSKSMISIAALACFGAQAAAQSGGPYEITSWTIDGGGIIGASGGSYTLSGTIGQPDAGPALSGGSYDLAGGFWPAAIEVNACPADLAAPFGILNFFDVAEYISRYNAGDAGADLAAPLGVLNFFDVAAFIAAYNAGCP